jgi:hypothetical protein
VTRPTTPPATRQGAAGYPDEPPFDPDYDHPTAATPAAQDTNGVRRAPHDLLAERHVLGAAMHNPQVLDECQRIVTAADFYNPAHETLWRTITRLAAADHPTGPQAVVADLVDHGSTTGRHAISPDLVFELYAACDVPAQAPYYAGRVDRLARRRTGLTALRRALQRLEAPGDDADIDQALADTAQALNTAHLDLANPPAPTSWTPVDLGPVLAGEYLDPPPTMLARTDGVYLFYDGAVHTVSGESESGKTWVCLLAALQLIETQHNVVFIDFEDRADRVIGRLMALGATPDQIRDHFAYIRPDRPLDDDARTQLAPHIGAARLVILDGVTEAMTTHGYDLNSNADSALFQALLPRWIADHGPAVVMIDHVVKDKEKQDRHALGAQHKLAGIDGAAYIVKTIQPFGRNKKGLARVDVAKDRPGHVREHTFGRTIAEFTLDATLSDLVLTATLSPTGDAHHATPSGGFEPTHLMEKISRYVQANPGLSKKAIEGAMNGKTDIKRQALELLVLRGFIVTKSGTRGAIQHHHNRAFYADDTAGLNDPDSTINQAVGDTADSTEEEAS